MPAAVLLTTLSLLLAMGALQSASIMSQTGQILDGADKAFLLAEAGVATGLQLARSQPQSLPGAGQLQLMVEQVPEPGGLTAFIRKTKVTTPCPQTGSPDSINHHFEIHATGTAANDISTTHVQGFSICETPCTATNCVQQEFPLTKNFWKALTGYRPE